MANAMEINMESVVQPEEHGALLLQNVLLEVEHVRPVSLVLVANV